MSYLDLTGLNTLWAKIKSWVSGQGYITDAPSNDKQYARKNGAWSEFVSGGGTWGSITGTLSNQTDLQSALNGKEKTIYKQAAEPSGAVDGDIWIDTDDSGEAQNGIYYGTCSTASNVSTKVVTCEDFVLEVGAIIIVNFAHGSSSGGKLNVNNTGAYDIWNGNSSVSIWNDNEYVAFRYSGSWQILNQTLATTSDYGIVLLKDISTGGGDAYTAPTASSVYSAITSINNTLSYKADSSDIPTKTSALTNDSNFVVDDSYVHTDNNFTSSEKTKLGSISGYYGVNNSGASNATKYVNCDNFVLETGAIITIRCQYRNYISDIKMNINMTGNKDAYNDDGTPLLYEAGELITLVYDGTAYYAVGRGAIQSINDTIGNVESLLAAL